MLKEAIAAKEEEIKRKSEEVSKLISENEGLVSDNIKIQENFEEYGPGNYSVEISDELNFVENKEDMVAKCYCNAQLHSWDAGIVEGASLPYICIVIEFC